MARLWFFQRMTVLVLVSVSVCSLISAAQGRTLLKSICRVKGQEENVLRGLGLVVGLSGTGDSGDYLPTMRALARSMELMGNPVSAPDLSDRRRGGLSELKDTKNVALVIVEATVPPTGARRGDKVDCELSAISAKSLAGGRLVFAALQGPVGDPKIYALASGRIHLDDDDVPTVGQIHRGCRMEEDFFNQFQKDGAITLVLNHNHADFGVATEVANQINERYRPISMYNQSSYQTMLSFRDERENEYGNGYRGEVRAQAMDPLNIKVTIPEAYHDDPVQFIAEVLSIEIYEPRTAARVVINERAVSIVIGGDVEIGSVVVSHKNIVVEAGANVPSSFASISSRDPESPKLKSLVKALEGLQVPTEDVIEIIKGIERDGKLYGQLTIE